MFRAIIWIVRACVRLLGSVAQRVRIILTNLLSRKSVTTGSGEKLVVAAANEFASRKRKGYETPMGSDVSLMNERTCTECNGRNLAAAQFCRHCGRPLEPVAVAGGRSAKGAGRASHPQPIPMPARMENCRDAADLYWRLESAFGGEPLIGTESLAVVMVNGGYALRNAVLQMDGVDAAGQAVFKLQKEASELPRGAEVRIEIASYEITEPVAKVRVSLVSAEYA